jgi:hypothetical protein
MKAINSFKNSAPSLSFGRLLGYLFFVPLKRTCPECQTELVYANYAGYDRATRTRALCRKCAASPSVIKKQMAEAEERAAKKSEGNFMAGFFEKIEANLSGSSIRKCCF